MADRLIDHSHGLLGLIIPGRPDGAMALKVQSVAADGSAPASALPPGRADATASAPAVLSTQDKAALDMASGTYTGAPTAYTPGAADIAAGRGISILATAAGNVSLKLSSGDTLVVAVGTGSALLPFAVVAVNTAGTTATATYTKLT